MRARPAPELLHGLRESDERWRRQMVKLPFGQKVRLVIEMQKRLLPVLKQRRSLQPWEQPWDLEDEH